MAENLRDAALEYHRLPTPGKISVTPTKAMATQRDLALACMRLAWPRLAWRSPKTKSWQSQQHDGRSRPKTAANTKQIGMERNIKVLNL